MGDHVTNIAETVYYTVEGRPIAGRCDRTVLGAGYGLDDRFGMNKTTAAASSRSPSAAPPLADKVEQ
jgi:hypothetical protein